MPISLNIVDKIIEVTTPTTEVTIQDLVNTIRDWEDELENLPHNKVIDAVGKADLGGGVATGIVVTLNSNWQLQFFGGSGYTVVKGGTLVGGVGSKPVKATGTSNDITVQIQPTDATVTTANTDTIEEGINDIKGTGFVKDTHSLKPILDDVTGLNGSAMVGTDGANTTTPPTVGAIKTELEGVGTKLTLVKTATDKMHFTGDDIKATLDNEKVALTDTTEAQIDNIEKIEQGRWKITGNQMIIYDTDGVTPLHTFNLKDKDGNPTETNITERTPI